MKQKILKILGYAFDPEIAELKAEEIMRLIKPEIMKISRASTKIVCNQCPHLKIVERKIVVCKRLDRRTWVFYCTKFKGDLFIDVIDTLNQDINNKELPLIIAPFVCYKRSELRKQGKESKFEMSIN